MRIFSTRRPRVRRSGRTLRTPAFILALALGPGAVHGQDASLPAARFRNLLEVQLLTVGSGEEAGTQPSYRATLQRRISFRWSVFASGLLLQDSLSHSVGGALGIVRSIPAGPLLVEPFVEVGAVSVDARVMSGSYPIEDPAGGTDIVTRYRASQGLGAVLGGGISASFVAPNGIVVRPGIGFWKVSGVDGSGPGRFRLSVSLGAGVRDDPWYALARDRTPPLVATFGEGPSVGDSVQAARGMIEIYASDANGIETLLVDDQEVEIEPAGGRQAAIGLHEDAVVARVEVSPPFEGQLVRAVARDRAGVITRHEFRAFGEPDVEAPLIEAAETTENGFAVTAVAYDFSGIAEAFVGVCPVPVRYLSSMGAESEGRSALAPVMAGWGDFPGSAELRVTDRSGNVARTQMPTYGRAVEANAAAPFFESVSATAFVEGGEWVLVEGFAKDPAGGWLTTVAVEGQPVVLRTEAAPETVRFKAWVAGGGRDQVTLTARTADGRTHTEAVEVVLVEDLNPTGRLEVLLLGSDADRGNAVRDGLRAGEESLGPVRVSAFSAQREIEAGLMVARGRVGPGVRVWVHIEGVLGGTPGELGPRIEFADGSSLSVASLARRLRFLDAEAVLVSSRIRPGRTWRVPLRDVPGAQPEPGCFDPDPGPLGAVASLPDVSVERILEALTGAGDRDGDGTITVAEVLDWAGVALPEGGLPFRPDAPLTVRRNER